jgi:hypothetical protein
VLAIMMIAANFRFMGMSCNTGTIVLFSGMLSQIRTLRSGETAVSQLKFSYSGRNSAFSVPILSELQWLQCGQLHQNPLAWCVMRGASRYGSAGAHILDATRNTQHTTRITSH